MEYKPLPIGIDNFEMMVTRGYYFVDKTLFIKELIDKKSSVNLFTRPRRFGKTLSLSMMQYFFEDMRNVRGERMDNRQLFEGLNIIEAGEKYLEHMGQYPVISLTLKDADQPDFERALNEIMRLISYEFQRHAYIIDSLSQEADRERFQKLIDRKAERGDFYTALEFLSRCLAEYFGKKVIILIDEYDVPLQSAYIRGFYGEMINFIRTLFSSALKTNASLEFAVITGCLRISKESIFTGLNNLKVISILNEPYGEYFGFTDEEVQKICADYGLSDKYDTVKEWYNGYLFGSANVYNPWSVIQYMFDHIENPDNFPESYWANTSGNEIVRTLINMADYSVKQEIEGLIAGGTIEKPIHEDITYDEVYKSMDNLWNFMFFTGYFRKVRVRMDGDETRYLTMCIPNREVRYIFRQKIMAWFDEQVRARDLTKLYTAVIEKDTENIENELNDIMVSTISYMDANESYYHGILTGLLTGMPNYCLKSNRESGTGRSDLFILPVSKRKEAFVMEFKKAKRIGQLESMAEVALQQIEDKNYKQQVYDDGYDIISSYGVAFCGKDCLVKWRA